MIYIVGARNPKNQMLEMVLTKPEQTGINVKNVTGITPIGGEIYITPFGTIDGGLYAGSRVPSRNVILTLGMWPRLKKNGTLDTIEESRLTLYNYFRIKDPIDLVFYTDNRQLIISGYTESVEVDIFSDHEEATVSIICVDPWFYTIGHPDIGFSGTRGTFEFPFSSENGSNNPDKLLEFGNVSLDTRMTIPYKGDIKTGFKATIEFYNDKFKNIYLYNMDTRETFTIYTDRINILTGRPLDYGDEIQISTVSGNKYASLLRDGKFTNIISAVDKNSDWFQLTKGDNVFAIASDYGVENINIMLNYEDRFAGI